jgi:hypothetical protein
LLKQLGDAGCPVFYLKYDPDPSLDSGSDLIRSAVNHWRGGEFSIRRPLDLVSAWSKIMSRIIGDSPIIEAQGGRPPL